MCLSVECNEAFIYERKAEERTIMDMLEHVRNFKSVFPPPWFMQVLLYCFCYFPSLNELILPWSFICLCFRGICLIMNSCALDGAGNLVPGIWEGHLWVLAFLIRRRCNKEQWTNSGPLLNIWGQHLFLKSARNEFETLKHERDSDHMYWFVRFQFRPVIQSSSWWWPVHLQVSWPLYDKSYGHPSERQPGRVQSVDSAFPNRSLFET